MELLDPDTGRRGRGVDVANERLVLEHSHEAVLRPQRGRQPATVRADQKKLDFVADRGLEARFRERGLDPAQRSPGARRNGCAVLLEKRGGRPRQPVTDRPQGRQVDAEALIADHADFVGERDAALVDGEGMPRGTGAQAGIGECVGLPDGDHLGLRETGGVHDGADDRVDAFGLQLGDRRGSKRGGCHGSHSAASRNSISSGGRPTR